jgi:formate-dependent nitrite reductase cytochrome c552 subunit
MTLLLALPEYAAAKKTALPENSGMCLSCHSTKGLTKVFGNNEKMSVFVSAAELGNSVHSALECNDCHQQISMSSHPGRAFNSRSAFALAQPVQIAIRTISLWPN